MKVVLIGASGCAVLLGAIACSQPKQTAVDKPQEPKTTDAQQVSTPAVPTATEVFQLRSECAKLGEKALAAHPSHNDNFTDSQVSHYNPLTNRCYVETDPQWADLSQPFVIHRFLWDGQTGELLASFQTNCRGTEPNKCARQGTIFGVGVAMIQADKALGNTDNQTVHDFATDAEAFIDNVMADDRKR